MNSWADGPFLGFDTETTGVDVTSDRIVTAALVHRDAAATRVRTWLVDPGVDIPPGVTAIHGVTTEHARAHGRAPAEALEEIAAEIAAAQAAGVPLVAYNAGFDLSLLEHELARHGLASLEDRLPGGVRVVLDPLVLDRHVDRPRKGPRKLVDLCEVYDVPTGDLHTAEVDVVATLDLLARMTARHPQLAAASPAQLHATQVRAHEDWARSYDRWRARRGLPWPGADHGWPLPARSGPGTRLARRVSWYVNRLAGFPRRLARRRRQREE
jgi:DNA polymerase III subunit epsilon